jgi:hypothetical protein
VRRHDQKDERFRQKKTKKKKVEGEQEGPQHQSEGSLE